MTSLRVLALAGPGDVLGTFERWSKGEEDDTVTHVPFSAQFFDACRDLDIEAFVVSSNGRLGRSTAGRIVVENRGSMIGGHGIAYHLSGVREAHRVTRLARELGAQAVFAGMTPHPYLIRAFLPRSVKIVAELHNALWSNCGAHSPKIIGIRVAYRSFFCDGCDAILSVSRQIKQQVHEVSGPNHAPFVDFLPLFRAEVFQGIPPPVEADGFRVMYAGRVERSKGIFDLLEVAVRLHRERQSVAFDICGTGSAMSELEADVRRQGLQDVFILHGWCGHDTMRNNFTRANVVVVPTRQSFNEGFNMVVVEALLAGRPVITSRVCPALEYVKDAAVEVPPDDPNAYYDAILRLKFDRQLNERLKAARASAMARFLDPSQSYGAAVRHVLQALLLGSQPRPRELSA